jgi:hypothetical protein
MLVGVGCEAEKEEVAEPEEEVIEEKVVEEETVEPEEEVIENLIDEDPINFFKFMGWTKEEIINYFDEEEPKTKITEVFHVFFFEEQNVSFFFREDKVTSILIHEGNQILGVIIDDEYDEEKIEEKLGKPDEKGMDRGAQYISYFVEDYALVFYKDFQGLPFSAAIIIKDFQY